MRAKAIQSFLDRDTGRMVLVGQELERDEERIEHLAKGGFVEVEHTKPEKGKRVNKPTDRA